MNIYKRGVEWLCAAGVMKPINKRVCLKAVLASDGGTLLAGKEDTRKAVCHLVTDVAEDVTKVKRGDMVLHISTATDAADFDREDARYVFCHEDDIISHWTQETAESAHRQMFPEEYPSHARESLVPEL
jgi:hypothetical protein